MEKVCVKCKTSVNEDVVECECGSKEFIQKKPQKPQVFLDECAG